MDEEDRVPLKAKVGLQPLDNGNLDDLVDIALETVRNHLGMAVAYLTEFDGEQAVFRAVSAPGLEHIVKSGDTMNLEDMYCRHIFEGRLPNVIRDTSKEPIAHALPITGAVPIGSHVGVPIHREDGSSYGMFCCLSHEPNYSLNERDLEVMETFATLAKTRLHESIRDRKRFDEILSKVDAVLTEQRFKIVYQPIFCLGRSIPAGFEALCRFAVDLHRPPNMLFDEAREVDKQIDLELNTISSTFEALHSLPTHVYVSINASPDTICSGRVLDLLMEQPAERIVLEVTEHAEVENYEDLSNALRQIAFTGARIAIDDVGAGYSGLSHILQLRPDIIKLDMALIRNVDQDIARQSLISGLIHFANATSARTIAEGIETEAELAMLRSLGVELGQGHFLGKPAGLDEAIEWFADEARGQTA